MFANLSSSGGVEVKLKFYFFIDAFIPYFIIYENNIIIYKHLFQYYDFYVYAYYAGTYLPKFIFTERCLNVVYVW